MARFILIDLFHVTILILPQLPSTAHDAIHQVLDRHHFQSELCRAVRKVIARYPAYQRVRVNLTP